MEEAGRGAQRTSGQRRPPGQGIARWDQSPGARSSVGSTRDSSSFRAESKVELVRHRRLRRAKPKAQLASSSTIGRLVCQRAFARAPATIVSLSSLLWFAARGCLSLRHCGAICTLLTWSFLNWSDRWSKRAIDLLPPTRSESGA